MPNSAPISPAAEHSPARAAVGDGAVEPLVAQQWNHVAQRFLRDRIADLHGAGRHRLPVERGGGHGGAVQAVAPGASAQHHQGIARLRLRRVAFAREDTQRAAGHQRVGGAALMKKIPPPTVGIPMLFP